MMIWFRLGGQDTLVFLDRLMEEEPVSGQI